MSNNELWGMKKEQHKSQQRYHQLYLRWKSSGKGARVFCEQESVKYSTFWYWAKRFKTKTLPEGEFIEMKVNKIEVKSSQPVAEIRVTDKSALVFYELPEPAWVKALLA
jgi:hypothetical protein